MCTPPSVVAATWRGLFGAINGELGNPNRFGFKGFEVRVALLASDFNVFGSEGTGHPFRGEGRGVRGVVQLPRPVRAMQVVVRIV